MTLSKDFLIDAAERVGMTALEAFLAVMVTALLAGQPLTQSLAYSALMAALTAALAAIKAVVASFIGDPDSASVLPSDI